jgi:hypothetical protein
MEPEGRIEGGAMAEGGENEEFEHATPLGLSGKRKVSKMDQGFFSIPTRSQSSSRVA